jgi:membrane protein YqaA with SNARE-associated domain
MKKGKFLHYLPIVTMITFAVSMSVFFYFASPETLIEIIGINNAYLLMFILSFIGGLSTFSGVPFHVVLIALAAGGVNPILLGLSTAVGVILGDSTSYLIGFKGREIAPSRVTEFLERIINFALKYPKILPWFFFTYAAVLPLSNDFIVITMGFAKYPFWKVMVPLALGNLVFNILLAYLAIYAYGFVVSVI